MIKIKYILIYCDNCEKLFHESVYHEDFKMDTGRDECPSCRILHGEDVEESDFVRGDLYEFLK